MFSQWRHRTAQITAGGRWTEQLSATIRQNLRWFWLDGVFAQMTESITLAYTSLFVLALGATRGQIGWMTALSSLSAAMLLLPGGSLADQRERRKLICLGGGGVARMMLLLMALLPFALSGPAGVAVVIGLVVIRESLGNLTLPAWTALTADIVPLEWRGRYFGARNFAMGLAGMAVTLLVGAMIPRMGELKGYQLALGLAWGAGMLSTVCFSRIGGSTLRPPITPSPTTTSAPFSFKQVRANTVFVAFCLAAALWNFSLNISGPFFNVYVLEGLGGDAGAVGILSVASALSALPGQRLFGELTDRWGPRRVQLLTGLLIPILPLAWVFVSHPWHVIPINLVAGFLWAGFLIANFNLLLRVTPEAQRPRYIAIYHIVVLTSLAAGAALGGVIVSIWGYRLTFLLSAIGRLSAALLFARFVTTPREPVPARESVASAHD